MHHPWYNGVNKIIFYDDNHQTSKSGGRERSENKAEKELKIARYEHEMS